MHPAINDSTPPLPSLTQPTTERWHELNTLACNGGGAARAAQQHANGKLTARERIEALLDDASFQETDQLARSADGMLTDGVVCGFGTINGRRIALYAQDFTINGGSLGHTHAQKICKIMDTAAHIGCPIIGLIDSGGARIQEGISALAGYGEIFKRNVRYSGIIPQISVILGPCAGGAAYSPALTDFVFAVDSISNLFITGPQVIEEVLGEKITKDALGGAHAHASRSGVVHYVAPNEIACFEALRMLLSYLPDNYKALPPLQETTYPEASTSFSIPEDMQQAYDIRHVINSLTMQNSFFELQPDFANNIVIGFARINNESVGIVANQPLAKAGTIDIDASCKAARFINFCDSFNIPILTLVDTPGFLPGVEQEHNGIIRHGAKLLYAYAQATVPQITVILRKAFGGAYIVMGSKHLGADFCFALPCAQIAVLGSRAASAILHGKEAAGIKNEVMRAQFMREKEQAYEAKLLNPFIAAEKGYVDAILTPEQLAAQLRKTFNLMADKVERLPERKHGNCPL